MPGSSRNVVSVIIGALVVTVTVGGCGGGAGPAVGNKEQSSAAATAPAGDPTSAVGDDAEGARREPEGGKRPEAGERPEAGTERGGGDDRGGGSAGEEDGRGGEKEDRQPAPEPRTLRELDAEVRQRLERGDPRDLEELTEQVLREAQLDSCPEHLQGSGVCLDRP